MSQNKTSSVEKTVNEHQRYVSISGNAFQKEIYSIIWEGLEDNQKVMVAHLVREFQQLPPIQNENQKDSHA